MEKFKLLWKGKYISVVSPIKNNYECIHENDIIMVLPIISTLPW